MPRVMVMPVDTRGCGHFRLLFPAWALQEQGCEDVIISTAGPRVLWDRPWYGDLPPQDIRVVGVDGPPPADVIVFQRPTVLYRLDALRHFKAAGAKVVVEVDDLLDSTSKAHVGHAGFAQTFAHHEILDVCCREADLVTVTTPALLDRYGYGHGVVLPNLVPAHYLHLEAEKLPGTVGWSGVVGTHPGDLQTTGGTLAALPKDWRVHVVGPPDGVGRALGLRSEPSATGWLSFEEYPAAMAELEVGVVPLADTAFNRAKSCLKMMEMASLGVPVVASPTPDNLRLHAAGVALVAGSRGQWRRHLARLCADGGYRAEIAGRGREAMARFTYEAHAHRWLEAWLSPLREKVAA